MNCIFCYQSLHNSKPTVVLRSKACESINTARKSTCIVYVAMIFVSTKIYIGQSNRQKSQSKIKFGDFQGNHFPLINSAFSVGNMSVCLRILTA